MAQEGLSSILFEVPSNKPKACVNCRRRKIKCDAVRPKCGQCSRSMGFQDCEFVDEGPTRTQMLEEQIAILGARIEDLEKPRELRSTFKLHNPYSSDRRSTSLPALSHGDPSGQLSLSQSELSFSTSATVAPSFSEGIPRVELDALVSNFLNHCSQFGFFLHVHNFREAVAERSGQRPTPALLDAVHLWAVHLAGPDFATHEAYYLSHALRSTVASLSGTHPNTVLHSIQAEVLLTHYFLRNTRFLEGKYHLSAAISLVLSSGLHRIRSADAAFARSGPLGPPFHALAPPRDAVEEMERVRGFWTVLTMNNCWTTADGSPSNISYTMPDARIDTPWPGDIDAPHNQFQELPELSIGTVTTFLANLPDSGSSMAALHAKAAILFEQASRLASQYRPNMTNDQLNQFYASFNTMDVLIEGFRSTLPAVQIPGHWHGHSARETLLVHALACVAAIQLHNPFVVDTASSRERAFDAARAVVADLTHVPVNDFGFLDPIMGTLLMATSQVFVAELARFRCLRPLGGPVPQEELALVEAIETVLAVMNVFAPTCLLMQSQLTTMQQTYRSV